MARRTLAPALRGMLTRRPPLERKGIGGRIRSFARQYVVLGQPYQQNWDTDRAIREGFEVNPWVYRAVHVIASALVAREMVLRQGDPRDGEPLDASADPTRLLHLLNIQANPWERAKVFRYRLIALWLLSSKGVFIQVIRTRAGRMGMLTLLDPDQVQIIPTREPLPDGTEKVDPLGAFRVTTPDQTGPYNDLPRFDPTRGFDEQPISILWVRSPHPTLMFQGMSAMQAAGLSADLDKAARLYNKRFLDADGRPGGVIMVKGQVTGDTLRAIEARAESYSGRIMALQGDAMDYADTSGSPRDTQWSETSDRMRSEVSMTFGVPVSVLGDASGRTFDNADAEKANFLEDTCVTLAEMLDDQLDVLTGAYDDELFLRHDWSGVWLLDRHKRADREEARAEVDAGLRTINEYRELRGLPRVDHPLGDALLVGGGKVIVLADPEAEKRAASAPTVGMGVAADPSEEARAGAQAGTAAGVRSAENINNATRLRLAATDGRDVSGALERREAPRDGLEGKEGGARVGAGAGTPVWR